MPDNTIIQMINETTIQIMAGIILLIAFVAIIKEHFKNKKSNTEEVQ
jgi:hypothetical protein